MIWIKFEPGLLKWSCQALMFQKRRGKLKKK
jgi:hypothetical protein